MSRHSKQRTASIERSKHDDPSTQFAFSHTLRPIPVLLAPAISFIFAEVMGHFSSAAPRADVWQYIAASVTMKGRRCTRVHKTIKSAEEKLARCHLISCSLDFSATHSTRDDFRVG
jgi:hypothetical protein